MWYPWKYDPGPCPVDDAPHTTCTSADYHGGQPIVVQQLPMRDLITMLPAPPAPPPVEGTIDTFSTKTYRGGKTRK